MSVIEIENVEVAYRRYLNRPTSLKEAAIKKFLERGSKHYETFSALKDISLSLHKGEVLGVVGSNGSGKSTLLKVLAGVLQPTVGRVEINGDIASLIELGAGFDAELNAIENIYLHGTLHRRNKSFLEKRIEHILSFAELKNFSHTPIKHYSSGMFARLGFSAAIDLNPDILLVDEILAVGDERFQKKCMEIFYDFLAKGKTIVLVSHDLDKIERLASRVLVLSGGKQVFLGEAKPAIQFFRGGEYRDCLGHMSV